MLRCLLFTISAMIKFHPVCKTIGLLYYITYVIPELFSILSYLRSKVVQRILALVYGSGDCVCNRRINNPRHGRCHINTPIHIVILINIYRKGATRNATTTTMVADILEVMESEVSAGDGSSGLQTN